MSSICNESLISLLCLVCSQKAILGDGEEKEGAGKRQLPGGETEEEVAGFDEADWDKKQAEVPFL